MNSYAQAVVWKWNGRVVNQGVIKELGGFIIGVAAAIKRYRAAVTIESAGKVHLADS
ncbi:hypothetical protein ES703_102557 [subsurface metagenome]